VVPPELNATGILSINSSEGVINIGNDGVAQKITVGGETSTRTEVKHNLMVEVVEMH
jgi:hypothetical protein